LSTRVHELAKELGLKSPELLDRIQKWGLDVKKVSALASLDPATVDRIRQLMNGGSAPQASKPSAPPKASPTPTPRPIPSETTPISATAPATTAPRPGPGPLAPDSPGVSVAGRPAAPSSMLSVSIVSSAWFPPQALWGLPRFNTSLHMPTIWSSRYLWRRCRA